VCLAVEKRITSPLMEPSSIEKIVEIDTHIGKQPEKGLGSGRHCQTTHRGEHLSELGLFV
jgi:hypothetical protein